MNTQTTIEQPNETIVAVNSQTLSGSLDAIQVSYAKNILITKTSSKPLRWIVDQIRTSEDLRSKVATIRLETSIEKRQALKKELLPYFCTASFHGGIRKNKFFKGLRYVVIDIDHILDKLEEIRKKLKQDGEVFIFFLSPSGDGFKVVFALDREISNEDEFRAIYRQLRQKMKERYGVETDNTIDPARACFLSYDPDLYINENCSSVSVDISNKVSNEMSNKRSFKELLSAKNPGDRTPMLASQVGTWIKRGILKEEAVEMCRLWNQRNLPPLPPEKVADTVNDMYERYDTASSRLPIQFFERHDSYYKRIGSKDKPIDVMITSFIMKPKELLVLDDNDCLVCDIRSSQGYDYPGVLIESADWHSKQKLLKAIGHQDCVCVGSDNDLQALCAHVNAQVPTRRKGTKVIGLLKDTWVIEGMNISSSGISTEPSIVPYDKGSGAFYHKIGYKVLPENETQSLEKGFYEDILKINEQKVVLPFIGWTFATPVKEIIREQLGSFPSILVHGGQGSGKTSTAKMIMRLVGYKNAVPNKCNMRPFPMLKNLSSTNGIPQFYDEFKQSDMKDDAIDSLLRYIREIYDGEMEQKGREDQTTIDYELLAPMAVMGEWNISQPAIRERSLMIRFSDSVKKEKEMRDAFQRLWDLPLEGFSPRYIEFCLTQDLRGLLSQSKDYVERCFEKKVVAPRIVNNLAVMHLGLVLFQKYAIHRGLQMPQIDPSKLLDGQLQEITGTDSGMVRSSVDQLIEELGIMWQKNEKQIVSNVPGYEPSVKQMPWWKAAKVGTTDVIAIRFNKVFPEFKEYAQRTHYEGDLLDKESYLKLFKECEYIVATNHPVDFDGTKQRSLCVDVVKAKAAGIDLEGFGVE